MLDGIAGGSNMLRRWLAVGVFLTSIVQTLVVADQLVMIVLWLC